MKQNLALILLLLLANRSKTNTPMPGERIWNILAQTELTALTTESKLDTIESLDFSGVYTALQEIINLQNIEISKLDAIDVGSLDPFIFTAAMLSKLEITQSLIPDLDSTLDTLNECIGTAITQDLVGTTGYTISAPGRYFLAENILFSPSSAGAAIEIDADEVFLDLNGFTITQDNTQLGVIGINVAFGHRNIVIQNGTLRNQTGQCIVTDGSTLNLRIRDISALNAGIGPGGVGDLVDGIEMGVNGTSNTGRNYIIKNLLCDSNQDEGADINGGIRYLRIENSIFTHNRGTDGGLLLEGAEVIRIANCQCSSNASFGINLSFSSNNSWAWIYNCQATSNALNGFQLNSNQNVVQNCFAAQNEQSGFFLTGDDSVLKNNIAERNGEDGISIDGGANNFIFGNTCTENTGTNYVTGANNSVLGNYAYTSSGTNYSGSSGTSKAVSVNATSAFITQPFFWHNVDATP